MILSRFMTGLIVGVVVAALNVSVWLYLRHTTGADDADLLPWMDLAAINLPLLFLALFSSAWIRRGVERLCFRDRYDVREALSLLNRTLAPLRTVDRIVSDVRWVLSQTVRPVRVALWLRASDGRFRRADGPNAPSDIALPAELATRIEQGEILTRHQCESGGRRLLAPVWEGAPPERLVPLRSDPNTIGVLVLGAKKSGRAYTRNDIEFLRGAAPQIALALRHAIVVARLKALNASLEQQIGERTTAVNAANADLDRTNDDLNRSLEQLQQAYRQLEQSQTSLLQADRLATLGRLSAGIAHEINTPLSAVQNALKVIADLGREYASSIGDLSVQPQDHREIATEIVAAAESAAEWAQKAANYIRGVKTHRRDAGGGIAERFPVGAVLDDTCALLAHRLRSSSCRVEFEEDPPGVTLVGNRAQLGQVLVNVVTNAIDAYETVGVADRRVQILARRSDETVTITVRDWAGGIPPQVLPHIFQEQFTTKANGQGSGLGLWIARSIVEHSFGGSLDVLTATGSGSCFYAAFPLQAAETEVSGATEPPILPSPSGADDVGVQLVS